MQVHLFYLQFSSVFCPWTPLLDARAEMAVSISCKHGFLSGSSTDGSSLLPDHTRVFVASWSASKTLVVGDKLRSWLYRDKLFLLNNSKAVGIWLLSSREQGDKGAVVICRQGEWPTTTRQEVKLQAFTKHLGIYLSATSQLFWCLSLQWPNTWIRWIFKDNVPCIQDFHSTCEWLI